MGVTGGARLELGPSVARSLRERGALPVKNLGASPDAVSPLTE